MSKKRAMEIGQISPCYRDETFYDESSNKPSTSLTPHFGANYMTRYGQDSTSVPSSSHTTSLLDLIKIDSSTGTREGSKLQNKVATPQCTQKKRIQNPSHRDVLYGRGGAINNHEGNVRFRSLVKERKEAYNNLSNKASKIAISRQILTSIKNLKGRFLEREKNYSAALGKFTLSGWWVEVSDNKAMSKTSQALREGAPYLRAKAGGDTFSKISKENSRSRSLRTKRKFDAQKCLVHKVSERSDLKVSEPTFSHVEKSRSIHFTAIHDKDYFATTPLVRVEAKQEVIDTKDATRANAHPCKRQKYLHENKELSTDNKIKEDLPAYILDELARPLPLYAQNPAGPNTWDELVPAFNSFGLPNNNFNPKVPLTNLFKNEEDATSLETMNVSPQHINYEEDHEIIDENHILDMLRHIDP